MATILTTKRLLLREFNLADTDFIIQLLNSPGWLQFIGNRNVKTKEEAANYIQTAFLNSYKKNGFGFWMVELKDNKTPIGMCGITKRDTLEGIDIGYALLPDFHGQGYAYEITVATLQYVLTTYTFPFILAITNSDNVRSIQLLEKMGLQFQQKIKLKEDSELLNLYRIDNLRID